MSGTEISINGRQFTITQECEVGSHLAADLQAKGYTGRQFIATGRRGAVKLVAETRDGHFVVVAG